MSLAATRPRPAPASQPAEPDDRALLERFRRGDGAAFELMVDRHQRLVSRLAFRLLGWPGEIDDVVQDVFTLALEKLPGFRGEARLATWLASLTVSTCRRRLRRRALSLAYLRRRWAEGRAADRGASLPADARACERERLDALRRALLRLSAADCEVLVLHYLERMPVAELSRVLGLRPNAVDVRLHRARRRLRALLPGLEG